MDICPINSICFDKNTFLLITVAGIVLITHFIGKTTDRVYLLEKDVYSNQSKVTRKINSYQTYIDRLRENRQTAHTHPSDAHTHQPIQNTFQQRIHNPLVAPERTYPYTIQQVPINIPTQGPPSGFQQVGVLIQQDGVGNQQTKLPLYGEQLYPRSKEWNYYIGSDGFQSVKLPITYQGRNSMDRNGCSEIYDGSVVNIDGYDSAFKATVYKLDAPKYLPHVL
jgi:hypothetical protein